MVLNTFTRDRTRWEAGEAVEEDSRGRWRWTTKVETRSGSLELGGGGRRRLSGGTRVVGS